ncbi:MAG: holo-[acyl-carrier-protein] synthase [Gammaproteobacteria bacterium]|jgi:holo-[acyl-carrier protein] synthase|nr:holo-[acyl-carrier-protein] synthase [Gammaproteobacteria bacterium]HJL96450.1 holo-ACP synthase [SAR86 cluster bacterium]|tara:strand:+ start:13122 stop:13511 length:390 start_codon:yes stop_codon:yes gene_type:complete
MIKGVGIDLVDKSRIGSALKKHGINFENKILSKNESIELSQRKTFSKKISYISNNFACKEALSKVLGRGFSEGIRFKDIEILRNDEGKPFVNLYGKALDEAKVLSINNIQISISDSRESSIAMAIGESL